MTWIAILSVESIETHIAKDREELAKAQAIGDEAVSYTHLTLPTILLV